MKQQNTFSRRQFLRALGATTTVTVVVACAPSASTPATEAGTDTSSQATESREALTVRYRTWHTPGQSVGDAAWFDWLAENYPEASGGDQVEYEYVPFGAEYIQKVLADSAAGTPPDLLHSSIIWAREFYDRGVLLDLNPFLDGVPELAPDQFYGESTTEYRSKDGIFYGVPWEGPDSVTIAVNSTLLAEAGMDPQGADIQTWDDFVEAAETLTKRDGNEIVQAGYLVRSHRGIAEFTTWLRSNGGDVHNTEITEPTFNNDKSIQVLEMQLDLLNRVSFPISPDRQDRQLFTQGQVAMIQADTPTAAQFEGQSPEGFKYWYILFPEGPQGSGPASTTYSNMFVIPKETENPERAFELMEYCTTPPVVIKRFELTTRTTPHKSIFDSDAWQQVLEEVPARAVTLPAAEGGVYPFWPFHTEANDALGIELEQVMTAGKDIQQALDEADIKIREIIERRVNQ